MHDAVDSLVFARDTFHENRYIEFNYTETRLLCYFINHYRQEVILTFQFPNNRNNLTFTINSNNHQYSRLLYSLHRGIKHIHVCLTNSENREFQKLKWYYTLNNKPRRPFNSVTAKFHTKKQNL